MSSYAYLGVAFACNGAWDVHLKRGFDKKNQFHSIIEYGSEVWGCNKDQADALESTILGRAKRILGWEQSGTHG